MNPFEWAASQQSTALLTTEGIDPWPQTQAALLAGSALYFAPTDLATTLDTLTGRDYMRSELPRNHRPTLVFDRLNEMLSADGLIDGGKHWWHEHITPLISDGFGIVIVEVLPQCGATSQLAPLADREWSRCMARARRAGVELSTA